MPDSITAALVGLCSTAFLELLRHMLARSQKTVDDATAFRHDLLSRIDALEEGNTSLIRERDEWQSKYYTEREQRVKAEWQLEALGWIAQELHPPADDEQ